MAQSTAGIKVYYTTGTLTWTGGVPSLPTSPTWVEIPDITSIPALGGEPNMLDSTVLSETIQKTYIAGLKDNGGSMPYALLLTPAVDTASAAMTSTTSPATAFKVSFPSPYNVEWWYAGKAQSVMPGEVEVDGVLSATLYTSIESSPQKISG